MLDFKLNRMKNIYIKAVFFAVILGFVSCDSQLDLAPTDIIIEESVFADIQTAESALSDVYFKLATASTGDAYIIGDASLGYVGLKEGSSYFNYSSGNLSVTDSGVESIWQKYYEVINGSNVFVDKVPKYGKYDENIKKQHVAEAKFCRAYSYWELLCFYGQGSLTGNSGGLCVPLRLTPYNGFNTSDLLPRNTNGEVYSQIIKDLTEAIVDLPEAYSNDLKTKSHATKASAYAMLSRVQLYKRDYQACLQAANDVLTRTKYQLDPNLLHLFPLNTTGTNSSFSDEVIFGFPYSGNKGNFQFGTHSIFYYNKYQWVNPEFLNSMDPADKRRTQLYFNGNPLVTDPVTQFQKTTYKFNNPDGRDDIQVIRLAEVLLNKAEVLAQLNDVNAESVALLNQIRNRSGLASVLVSNYGSKEELLSALYKERLFESAFEGRARFDFIRTNRPLRNPTLSENRKTFPIPQREIDISKGKLIQNEGYN